MSTALDEFDDRFLGEGRPEGLPAPTDPCVCGHDRDEHDDWGRFGCEAIVIVAGEETYCTCGEFELDEDALLSPELASVPVSGGRQIPSSHGTSVSLIAGKDEP